LKDYKEIKEPSELIHKGFLRRPEASKGIF